MNARLAFAVALPLAVPLIAAGAPPREGAMLIVPLIPARQAEVIDWIARADAGLIGSGPVPGSLIVIGNRDAIVRETWRHGAITLAARPEICTGRNGWNE
ncbi:hypothetical protein K9B35_13705 [Sphingomonas sp. R647]|uniref:hypothetical protein n=1 Tax=Sphingomonas sp. R647 TaxID=2875233 RepID=UPI001CD51ED8|nr:hypothetical protein [Sphingomonas sp. R647]MCA1199028.1 hypothetical protein [Sphingomonas sp. R647]